MLKSSLNYGTYTCKKKDRTIVVSRTRRQDEIPNCLTDSFLFHPYDWYSEDVNDDMSDEYDRGNDKKFTVFAKGVMKNGTSVAVKIVGFKPYFFIKLPERWHKQEIERMLKQIDDQIYFACRGGVVDKRIVKAKSLYYYCGNDKSNFLQLVFKNKNTMYSYANVFHKQTFMMANGKREKLELFESNLNPMLRFFHVVDIEPAHWIELPPTKYTYVMENDRLTTCQLELVVHYTHLKSRTDLPLMSSAVFAGFDIEASSSHGDFPLGNKDYNKSANEIMDAFLFYKGIGYKYDKYKWIVDVFNEMLHPYACGATIKTAFLKNGKVPDERSLRETANGIYDICLKKEFNVANYTMEYLENNVITNDFEHLDEQCVKDVCQMISEKMPEIDYTHLFTTNYLYMSKQILNEINRLYHNKIDTFISSNDQINTIIHLLELGFNPSFNNITINKVFLKNLEKVDENKLSILGINVLIACEKCYEEMIRKKRFDEKRKTNSGKHLKVRDFNFRKKDDFIVEINDHMNNVLPPVEGDKCIQIGTTFQRYGEKHCFLKHIIVLDTANDITNIDTINDENKDVNINDETLISEMINLYKIDENTMLSSDIKKQFNNLTSEKKTELRDRIIERAKNIQIDEDDSEVIVESYKTEREVLIAWARLIRSLDPEILVGYNIFGFDYDFMYKRAVETKCENEFMNTSIFKFKPSSFVELNLSSSGLGDNVLTYIDMFGRISIDLMKRIQNEQKLDTYTLNNVCYLFLNKKKNDLPPQKIFIKQRGNAYERTEIARYCIVDCLLCNRLMDKFQILGKNICMANVCSVPLSYLFFRGQGVKLFSLVAKYCRTEGYLIPVINKDDIDEDISFEGAVVLSALIGNHRKPIAVGDYNSLYPSCMISHNLSPDTFVKIGGKYDNLPGVTYIDVEYDNYIYVPDYTKNGKLKKNKKKIIDVNNPRIKCRYVQYADGSKGIIPRILQKLLQSRKDTRKVQSQYSKKSFEWAVKEGEQLAYKITANSLYGQLGARTSPIFFLEVASSVTAVGRENLEFARDFIEKHYVDSKVIYGDSVVGNTPIIYRQYGRLYITEIQDLQKLLMDNCRIFTSGSYGYVDYPGFKYRETDLYDKQYVNLSNKHIEILTKNGWKFVTKLVKHRTYKQIFLVYTKKDIVEVTSDHSLIDFDGKMIKPQNVEIGKTRLMRKRYVNHEIVNFFTKTLNVCEYFGVNINEYISNVCLMKDSVEIACFNRSNVVALKLLTMYLEYVCYDENIDYKVIVDTIADKYSVLMYYSDKKNDKSMDDVVLGVVETTSKHNRDEIMEYEKDYFSDDVLVDKRYMTVYDIETEDGTFCAGIGDLVLKNTDSIFIRFSNKDMFGRELSGQAAIDRSIELCIEGSSRVSERLRAPHNLEFEKCIYPFLLFSKKRYHGHYYTVGGSDNYYQNSMGIALKRRDYAPIVKKVYGGAIDIIMRELNLEKALDFVRTMYKKIYNGEFPLEDFIITKTLKAFYKDPERIGHKVLADRIKIREPGNAPRPNDRISFVYIQTPATLAAAEAENRLRTKSKKPTTNSKYKILHGDRIETPEYIREKNLKIDYRFYVNKHMRTPITQLFELDGDEYTEMLNKWVRKYDTSQKRTDIRKYMKRQYVIVPRI